MEPTAPALAAVRAQAARCEDLLARHLAAAVHAYGAAALDVLDLPPLSPGPIDAEALRVAAVLLWTAEVEAAGVPGFAEALAEAVAAGRLMADLGPGGDRLLRWWRDRRERFAPEERAALYQRLFGAESGFPTAFADLLAALDGMGRLALGEAPAHQRALVETAARALAEPLSQRATGIAGFAARDLVEQVRTALDLLADRGIDAALGGRGAWNAIRLHGQDLLGRVPDVAAHLARARAGHDLIAWLADRAAELEGGALAVAPGDAAVAAAQAWLASEGR